jgi:hypothetical protein
VGQACGARRARVHCVEGTAQHYGGAAGTGSLVDDTSPGPSQNTQRLMADPPSNFSSSRPDHSSMAGSGGEAALQPLAAEVGPACGLTPMSGPRRSYPTWKRN